MEDDFFMNEKNAKIAVVLGSNIHWAPYYYRYENLLRKKNIPFDLIIWNRENIDENSKAQEIIEYKAKDKSDNKNPFKIIKFIIFSGFVKRMINEKKYNKIIFLGTHGCAPVFLANFLKRKLRNKYWLDIRDYQYEWFKPFYYLEDKCIKNSYATTISSKGYEEFLPKHKYFYMHNIDSNIEYFVEKYKKNRENSRIRISFIGNVRYYEENIKLINIFSNDERFLLQYFGAGSDILKEYCNKNHVGNVNFYGKFEAKDTINFYNNTDIINNVYGNEQMGLTTALSNKLYYALAFRLPILVCENTYMEKLTSAYNFGFVFENSVNFPDELYRMYDDYLNNKNSIPQHEELWKKILADEKEACEKFEDFLNIL